MIEVMKMTNRRVEAVQFIKDNVGQNVTQMRRSELKELFENAGKTFPHFLNPAYGGRRAGTGVFMIPNLDGTWPDGESNIVVEEKKKTTKKKVTKKRAKAVGKRNVPTVEKTNIPVKEVKGNIVESDIQEFNFIPEKCSDYVKWGHDKDLRSIIQSKIFYPVYITGHSGNGKTFMVEQVCSESGRECFRVNITEETDEGDLIGGFRLHNGDTVWFNGPVVDAMLRGAVLLLDEIDLASTKIMCLQPVLEGKGIFIKKINKWVKPAEGFNIVATANTKGQGDDSGRYIGANVMNEAFLERFPVTFEQPYPTIAIEKRILAKVFTRLGIDNEEMFIDNLCTWAGMIRKSFEQGAVEEVITTRRLVHISTAYSIFNDKMKSIDMGCSRFVTTTKDSFIDLYKNIDAEAMKKNEEPESAPEPIVEDPIKDVWAKKGTNDDD